MSSFKTISKTDKEIVIEYFNDGDTVIFNVKPLGVAPNLPMRDAIVIPISINGEPLKSTDTVYLSNKQMNEFISYINKEITGEDSKNFEFSIRPITMH